MTSRKTPKKSRAMRRVLYVRLDEKTHQILAVLVKDAAASNPGHRVASSDVVRALIANEGLRRELAPAGPGVKKARPRAKTVASGEAAQNRGDAWDS